MDEAVFVPNPNQNVEDFSMTGNNIERSSSVTSTDSTFSIVPNSPAYYPSLNTALSDDGNIYEKRADIAETKKLPDRLSKKVTFYDKDRRAEVLERVNARENLDQEIENEIKHVEELQSNCENANPILVAAAEGAHQNMVNARKVASDGKTTVKRGMEIIELALPAFVSTWSKSQEDIKLNDEVMNELSKFEESRQAVAEAGRDIEKRQEKTEEFTRHLEKAIALAETDVAEIVKKKEKEESENRIGNCTTTKTEIDVIVSNESEEVEAWLVSCKSDREEIKAFQAEQHKRHDDATADHKKRQDALVHKINLNKKQQDELRKKLKELEEGEKRMEQEKMFQQEVQKKAEELHKNICEDMSERFSSIVGIETRADTSRKVVELMTTCGNELIKSSIEAEKNYLEMLAQLEKEAKQRLRASLANSAVEKRIKVEYSVQNMEDCRENMKVFKAKWTEAAKKGQKLNAKRNEESYEDYKKEMKREKAEKVKAEESLTKVMEKLSICDDELKNLKVPFESVNDLYEIRMQELAQSNDGDSNLSSLDSDMESEDEDFDDAQS